MGLGAFRVQSVVPLGLAPGPPQYSSQAREELEAILKNSFVKYNLNFLLYLMLCINLLAIVVVLVYRSG